MIFLSNFQTNTLLHPASDSTKNQSENQLEAKKGQTGTVFMGPLSHREETVDTILRSQANGAWSEEIEAQYMESVRNKATAKVRAMLLQAKRRGDEIITEAEVAAQQVIEQANAMHAQVAQQQAQIQGQFDEAYGLGTQKAMEDVQNILEQNQKALGESTAVVLLSIHQQLQKFYDVWREELRLLTLEAIKVGSGWVGDGKKEEILADMLDECVRKMVEKTRYTVRVHPSDGALVSQVLENSKEKDWTMETSNDLEPGSLELEGTHALVKNQSGDRKRFVQEILDELILPKKPEEAHIVQNVTDTLMGEMSNNPLLAQNTHDNVPVETMPQENELKQEVHTDMPLQHNEQEILDINYDTNQIPQELMENTERVTHENESGKNNPTQEISHDNLPNQETESIENATSQVIAKNMSQTEKSVTSESQQGVTTLPQETPITQAPQVDANAEAQDLVDSFLADDVETKPETNNVKTAQSQKKKVNTQKNSNKKILSKEKQNEGDNILPTDIADDLLSEMGFGEETPK